MHHLRRGPVAVQALGHFETLTRARTGFPGEPRSGRRALAASSSRAGRKDDGAARRDSMGEELDRRS